MRIFADTDEPRKGLFVSYYCAQLKILWINILNINIIILVLNPAAKQKILKSPLMQSVEAGGIFMHMHPW